jgi:hypothetical protein
MSMSINQLIQLREYVRTNLKLESHRNKAIMVIDFIIDLYNKN